MIEKIKTTWHDHGTKVIGFSMTVVGTLSMLDASTIHIIEKLLGETWGHKVANGLLILGGAGTAYRGFTNSKRGL